MWKAFIRSGVCFPAPWGGYNWQHQQKMVVDGFAGKQGLRASKFAMQTTTVK
jgi:hypothetical protein